MRKGGMPDGYHAVFYEAGRQILGAVSGCVISAVYFSVCTDTRNYIDIYNNNKLHEQEKNFIKDFLEEVSFEDVPNSLQSKIDEIVY